MIQTLIFIYIVLMITLHFTLRIKNVTRFKFRVMRDYGFEDYNNLPSDLELIFSFVKLDPKEFNLLTSDEKIELEKQAKKVNRAKKTVK